MLAQQNNQLSCSIQIDYSQVIGERILPFVITLDLANSVLSPAPGQNQRFCYVVTGVGTDNPEFADLSHIVFGICPNITANQIVNITVNGVPQTISEDGNVQLRTPENPDPPTGCPGLKFDFGLNKVGGVLNICYELTTPFPVGPNTVCLFGGNVTANTLSICGPVCSAVNNCTEVAFQPATVCAPVVVTPFATAGETTTFCCGEAVITPNTGTCAGTVNGSCRFTLTQDICIRVPVAFGATTTVGAPSVTCENATDEDICTECGSDTAAAAENKALTNPPKSDINTVNTKPLEKPVAHIRPCPRCGERRD